MWNEKLSARRILGSRELQDAPTTTSFVPPDFTSSSGGTQPLPSQAETSLPGVPIVIPTPGSSNGTIAPLPKPGQGISGGLINTTANTTANGTLTLPKPGQGPVDSFIPTLNTSNGSVKANATLPKPG